MNGLGAVGEGLAELRVAPVGAPALSPGGDVANVAVMSARLERRAASRVALARTASGGTCSIPGSGPA
jgi:hypothetical protein